MEQRFVPLGDDLGRIVRHLQALAQTAGEGFASIREEVTSGALGELDDRAQAALDALSRQLSGVNLRMRPLADVASELHRLRALGRDVQRLGAFLQACGSSFAVESARAEESRAAFASFVDELRSLASRIAGISETMDQDSATALRQLAHARTRICENLSHLEGLAQTMRGAFVSASGEIQGLLEGMRGMLDRVERHRRIIQEQTGSLVFYLQFGDLVRQKCEHVLAAAREADSAAESASANTLSVVVRTSVAQLELIQREVDDARGHLADGYSALGRELGLLAGCGRSLDDSEAVAGTDPWKQIKARLQELENIQEQEETLNADAVRTAGEAGAASAALQQGLGSVREMSRHLHLLALNAIIQTVHLGVSGRALEELAQHVDSLHRTCETLVPEILGVLERIAGLVGHFSVRDEEPSRLDLAGLQQLEDTQARSQLVMKEVLALSSDGEEMLRTAVQRLDTLHTLSAEIEEHRAALSQLAARLPTPPVEANGTRTDLDDRMLQRYTMQSERDAHQRAMGIEPAAAASDDIELFTNTVEPTAPEPVCGAVAAGGDDLGDNVELF